MIILMAIASLLLVVITVLDEYHDFVEKEYHTKSLKVHCKSFNGMHFGLSLKILQRHAA
jgi:hypothetical protein